MSLPLMVVSPGDNVVSPITVNGRTYASAAATAITVPSDDGLYMLANGWVGLFGSTFAGAGPTTSRPTSKSFPPVAKGQFYVDTTANVVVVYSGPVLNQWYNAATGAVT